MADAQSIKSGLLSAFRDFKIDGVPASGPNEPEKAEIRAPLASLVDYVAAVTTGLRRIDPVRAVSTTNVALTGIGNGAALDGVELATGDRVALVGQTNAAQNGVYVSPASGTATRAADLNENEEFPGATFLVREGMVGAGTSWTCINPTPPAAGTDAIVFVQSGQDPNYEAVQQVIEGLEATVVTSSVDEEAMLGRDFNVALDAGGPAVERVAGGVSSGLRVSLAWQDVRTDQTRGAGLIAGDDFGVGFQADGNRRPVFSGAGGLSVAVATLEDVAEAGSGESAFTRAELSYVDAEARTEAQRLNGADVSAIARVADGANLLMFTGQSFDAGTDSVRLFLTASRQAMLGVTMNAWSVGPDARCVNAGGAFVTYDENSRVLEPLRETFVAGTNIDARISDVDISKGNYPLNARGGAPQPAAVAVYRFLSRRWTLQTEEPTGHYAVAMSHSKTDGLISELATGDGLSRAYSAMDVFAEAVDALDGAAPSTVGSGQTDPMNCAAILMNHGEADENALTATYAADVNAFHNALTEGMETRWVQAARPPMLMLQVGGPRYAMRGVICARQQSAMMRDLTGANASVFVVGTKTEVPSFYNLTTAEGVQPPLYTSPHPNHDDGHPTLAGNVLMGIRYGIGLHYLLDRRENYWLPFPFKVYFRGRHFLIAAPCMVPPLRAAVMPFGCVTRMLADKGITFENGGGVENPVVSVDVVPGYDYLIQGECQADIASFTTLKAGKGQDGRHGVVNFRDSFDIALPFDLPFDANQTQYGNAQFGAGGDTGEGWKDNPATNGLGRYVEAIPGWVGKPDLGNPMLRDQVTAQPLPTIA